MLFKLFIPYQGSLSESNEVNDYYASAEEYVAALQQEESTNGSVIFNAMASGDFSVSPYYGQERNKKYNIKDVVACPKTASAMCLMSEAPNTVDVRQLDDLGIEIKKK